MDNVLSILLDTTLVCSVIFGFLVIGGWLTDQYFTQTNRIIEYIENRRRSDK